MIRSALPRPGIPLNLLLFFLCRSAAAPLLAADFTDPAQFPEGSVNGRGGWVVEQGEAAVRVTADGMRALVLEPGSPHTQASWYFTVPEEAAEKPLWIDLEARLGVAESDEEFLDAGGSLAALLRVEGDGRLMVWNATGKGSAEGQWLRTHVSVALDESGKMKGTARFTLRQDREAGLWDLHVNGMPAAANLGILPRSGEESGSQATERFTLMGQAGHPVELARVSAGWDGTLFQDANHDGLPDPWQKNLSKAGREEDADADGLTNTEEYFFGTDPSKARTGALTPRK